MKPLRRSALRVRGLCLFTALFVVAFLVDSSQHRVHHLFENVDFSRHHEGADSHQSQPHRVPSSSTQPDCVFQSVAGHCHSNSTPSIHLTSFDSSSEKIAFPPQDNIPHFAFEHSFRTRAPPLSA